MPSRIIREGINDSKAINRLSDSAEIFYRRLMMVVDDYGRFEADSTLLRAKLFAFKLDEWPEHRIQKALAECANLSNGSDEPLVLLYVVGKKQLLEISNFQQRKRASKYAAPGDPPTMAVIRSSSADKAREATTHATRQRAESKLKAGGNNTESHSAVADVEATNCASLGEIELAGAGATSVDWFEEFWALFWRGEGKKSAKAKFASIVKTSAHWAVVKAAVQKQRTKMLERDEVHRPHAATWLAEERWADEESPPKEARAGLKNADDRNQQRRDDLNQGLKILRKKRV